MVSAYYMIGCAEEKVYLGLLETKNQQPRRGTEVDDFFMNIFSNILLRHYSGHFPQFLYKRLVVACLKHIILHL